jgi:dephospho-CoA kinase
VLKIGLTGGVASGKTTVAEMFAALGAGLVDTDVVAREVVQPGSPGLAAVAQQFGPDVITATGELDRQRMRRLVFADRKARTALEGILHPLIRSRALELVAESTAPYVIIAVPLLLETGFFRLVDRILVVDCPESQQIERLMRRDGSTESEARAMLAAQTDRDSRREAADEIIDNSGPLNATQSQVETLHRRYLELARDCAEPEGRAE